MTGPTPSTPTADEAPDPDGSDQGSPVDRAKAEAERTKQTLLDARNQVGEAVERKRGGPATSVDDATAKAESLRRDIEHDLASLSDRIPDPQDLSDRTKTIGMAVGGGALTLGALRVALKKRGARKAHDAQVREKAVAIARELARIDLDEIAEEVAAESQGGGRKRWLVLVGVLAGAGAYAWQRSSSPQDPDDVFGPSPSADPATDPWTNGGPHGIGAVGPPPPPTDR